MDNEAPKTNVAKSVDENAIPIMKSDIAAAHNRLTEIEAVINGLISEREDMARRLSALENFLPILGETFAGRIGGTSDDSAAIMDALNKADPDALREALARFAAEAKKTEIPPGGDEMASHVSGVEDYVKAVEDDRPAYMRE